LTHRSRNELQQNGKHDNQHEKHEKSERETHIEKHNEKQIDNRTHRMENLTTEDILERENEKHEYLYINIILERVLVLYVPHSSQMVRLYL